VRCMMKNAVILNLSSMNNVSCINTVLASKSHDKIFVSFAVVHAHTTRSIVPILSNQRWSNVGIPMLVQCWHSNVGPMLINQC
jgi:hypothetical protein